MNFISLIGLTQVIERVSPKLGYFHWSEIYFVSSSHGFVQSESGEIFETQNQGASWKRIETMPKSEDITASADFKKIKLSNYTKANGSSEYFIPLSKINDSIFIGRNRIYNPYLIKSNAAGTNWSILNGFTSHSISSILTDEDEIVVTDNCGNVFYSQDSGESFVCSRKSSYFSKDDSDLPWPVLKKSNNFIYAYDADNKVIMSSNYGRSWQDYFSIERKYGKIKDLLLVDSTNGYFMNSEEIFQIKNKSVEKLNTNESERFISLLITNNNSIIVCQNGSLLISEKKDFSNLDKTIVDTSSTFTSASFNDSVLVLTTNEEYIFLSQDLKKFEKIQLLPGYFAETCTFKDNFVIFNLEKIETYGQSLLLIYNLENKQFYRPHRIDKGKYFSKTIGVHKNLVFGTLGDIQRVNTDLLK